MFVVHFGLVVLVTMGATISCFRIVPVQVTVVARQLFMVALIDFVMNERRRCPSVRRMACRAFRRKISMIGLSRSAIGFMTANAMLR